MFHTHLLMKQTRLSYEPTGDPVCLDQEPRSPQKTGALV